MNKISKFDGAYRFLSNFYEAPVTYRGYQFPNNEAAFQAAKCPERMAEFCDLNPSAAKRLGRRVQLRPEWESIKDDVMYTVCKAKFLQNVDLLNKLLDTGDAELIEGNTWGDKVWGVCNGEGENRLGKILMRIRSEIRDGDQEGFCDELGGFHEGGVGYDPDGVFCGECPYISCGRCSVWMHRNE